MVFLYIDKITNINNVYRMITKTMSWVRRVIYYTYYALLRNSLDDSHIPSESGLIRQHGDVKSEIHFFHKRL